MCAATRSESDLLADAAAGSEPALRELIQRNQSAVYRVALAQLRQPAWAAEASQEVFVRLFRSLRRLRGESSLATWLHRVTLNLCRDQLRERKRDRDRRAPLGGDPPFDPETDRALMDQESSRALREAIARLPDTLGRLVELRYFQELSYLELAQTLDLPLGTVCTRLQRAIKLLADELEERP